MNYKQMLKIGGVDLGDMSRPSTTDEAITILRAYALAISTWRQPLALAMATAGVKRRVAKRWASRLIREGLPREARLAGHHKRCRWMYRADDMAMQYARRFLASKALELAPLVADETLTRDEAWEIATGGMADDEDSRRLRFEFEQALSPK